MSQSTEPAVVVRTASIKLLMDLVDATYQARNAGSLGAAVREVNSAESGPHPAGSFGPR